MLWTRKLLKDLRMEHTYRFPLFHKVPASELAVKDLSSYTSYEMRYFGVFIIVSMGDTINIQEDKIYN